jgi:hypothetical protein
MSTKPTGERPPRCLEKESDSITEYTTKHPSLSFFFNNHILHKMAGAAGLGFHPHFAGFTHRFVGKALGATMWFWMMYRTKQDMPVLLVKILYSFPSCVFKNTKHV